MKKYLWLTLLTTLVLMFACIGDVHAEIIPRESSGRQIGYSAVVLCEKLTLRENPSSSSSAIRTLNYGEKIIAVSSDSPKGAIKENGFVFCCLGESEDSPGGWVLEDYIVINPAWYVTETQTPVYAWNNTSALKVALLDKGTRLPILKEEGAWYLVSLRGAAGWIHK